MLKITRVFDAPREPVFEAFSDPEGLRSGPAALKPPLSERP
jgi:hypothetical protein